MNSIDDFVALIRTETGLAVLPEQLDLALGDVPGWDSVQLLWLAAAMERATGRPVSLPDLLEASSLHEIYVAVAA